jgi:uncharacterized protein (DUF885 family)
VRSSPRGPLCTPRIADLARVARVARKTTLRVLAGLGVGVLLLSPSYAQTERDAAREFNAVVEAYERLAKRVNPVSASHEGDREALRRWPDASPQASATADTEFKMLRGRLAAIDSAQLDSVAALNYTLLVRLLDEQIDEYPLELERIPYLNDSGFHTLADYVARTTRATRGDEADDWIARLEGLPKYYEQNIANARRGVRDKVNQPRIVVERVLEIARQQAATPPAESPLLQPLDGLPERLRDTYRRRAIDIIATRIAPAQRAFVTFLEREALPSARKQLGIRSVPGGEAMYRHLVRKETTAQLTPDEIHALGLAEVARIRKLMEEDIRRTGFEGSFEEFLTMLRTEPRFYARTAQELLEKASEIAKRADDRLPALFGTLPRLPYGVRSVPAEIAEAYTTGRYWSGSMALGQAGGYMVNTSKLDQRPLYELPALTLHEAVPGHHLQLALAQELAQLPYFRRTQNLTAFVEGWGLYAEFLGEEMGIYRDAYERFGRYSYEMWRACRLVADTGIHWLGWDIEQARRCFTENSALAPHNIQTELERYIGWPGQALAYKIGELKLRELRTMAEQALGERFNVRKFHDFVLMGGSLPLDVLEQRVKHWIEQQHAAEG